MNKSILSLMILGLVLAMVHTPDVLLTLSMITGLVIVTVKLFWRVMQSFASAGRFPAEGSQSRTVRPV